MLIVDSGIFFKKQFPYKLLEKWIRDITKRVVMVVVAGIPYYPKFEERNNHERGNKSLADERDGI